MFSISSMHNEELDRLADALQGFSEQLERELCGFQRCHVGCLPSRRLGDQYDMSELPSDSGIYFIQRPGESGAILYIGKATNLRNRCSNSHAQIKQAINDPNHRYILRWLQLPRNIISSCEEMLINKFQPDWNVHGISSRYWYKPKRKVST